MLGHTTAWSQVAVCYVDHRIGSLEVNSILVRLVLVAVSIIQVNGRSEFKDGFRLGSPGKVL